MSENEERPVGLTRDVGWQIGARRTLPVEVEAAWALLISVEGQQLWLGGTAGHELARGLAYHLADGTQGKVTTFKPLSHLRLTWHPPTWPRPSIIQVRAMPARSGTTIAFHQEHLPGPEVREERRGHFNSALEAIEQRLVNTPLTSR